MEINKKHVIEKSEKNENGKYEWYYEFDLYSFTKQGISIIARSYVDRPTEIEFLRIEVNGMAENIKERDLNSELFLKAMVYVKENEKKEIIKWQDVNNKTGYSLI